MIRMLTALS